MNRNAVLIVDDDETDVLFLADALKKTVPGLFVASVPNGQQAIDYLAGRGKYADRTAWPFPTHMFLDLKIPLVSGFQVLEWVRSQQQEIAQLPVTVLSGSELASDIERVQALGADYRVKPIEYAALLALAREYAQMFL